MAGGFIYFFCGVSYVGIMLGWILTEEHKIKMARFKNNSREEFTFELLGDSPLAHCVSEDGGRTKKWLPKSQTTVLYKNEEQGIIKLSVPVWLASEKGLAGY